ncbi:MAG: InlB B-repeat-containing protein [Bacilli bacterium]|nr:InlB B-repeat-containing protein [Bacilli bacterium]
MKRLVYFLATIFMGLCLVTGCGTSTDDPVDDPDPIIPEVPEDTRVTLYFETYGGEEIEPVKVEPGTTVNLPTPKKEGYTFDYWYTTPDLAFNTDLRKTVQVNETMTVYAGWFALDYNIHFITNCGVKLDSINALTDEEITLPIIERDNYEFLGWYENDELYTRTTMEPRDITLTAKWGPLLYDVKLDTNGGTIDSKYANQSVEKYETILLPTPVKNGYTFLGWYNGETLVTEETLISSDMTLTAKYDDTSKYTSTYKIEYILDGGKLASKDSNYKAGEEVVLGTPTKEGYTFLGWYLNENFEGSSIDKVTVSDYGNKTVYAKWIETNKEFVITYLDHNGNVYTTKNVKYGSLAENVKYDGEGYIEYQWFEGNKAFDFSTPIESDITLSAKWSILKDILADLLPNRATSDLYLPGNINTSLGDIDVVWSSSDINTISIRGIVNPLREDTVVTLTATFSYKNQSYTHSANVIVDAVQLRDLSSTTPVFAYFSSNMGSYKGLSGIPLETIDVINYCFARVTDSGQVSMGELIKIGTVVEARKQGVRVLFSLGAYGNGETGCGNISRAASTSEGRKKLIESIIYNIERYHLDGVDIDWEYPGHFPASGISSAQDRLNYMAFMRELRVALDELGDDYLLTAAIPGGYWGPSNYDLPGLAEVLDYLHMMTYDLHSSWATTHHTALYSSNYAPNGSVDAAVTAFIKGGFPKEKLVVGAAFYGRIWRLTSAPSSIMGASNIDTTLGKDHVTYTTIKQDYLKRSTVRSYWDEVACAPYIYDSATHEVISYDNPNSIKHKCRYVLEKELGGLMFWDYGEDTTGSLVNAIYEVLKKPSEE